MFRLQIGGTPVKNVNILGDFGFLINLNPDFGDEEESEPEPPFIISSFGGGLSYYFMPENFHISVAPAFFMVRVSPFHYDGDYGEKYVYKSNGYGINFSLGKEAWISEHWSIGLALVGSMFKTSASKKFTGDDDGWYVKHSLTGVTGYYLGACLSITYN